MSQMQDIVSGYRAYMSCERKFTDDESERISRLSESLDLQGYLPTGALETQAKPVCVLVTHCVCYLKS